MKVALVCAWYHPRVGGIELHLHDLATRLIGAGHDVVVVTPTPGPPVVDGVRVSRVRAPRAPGFGFLITPGGVRALTRAIAAEAPRVVHAHVSIVSPAALGGAVSAERLGIPLAVTFHSVVPQTRALARVAGGALGASRWRARLSAVSRRVANDVQPFAPRQDIRVLPNGVDVAFWRTMPARANAGDGAVQLVSVMRLNAKKRPLALVRMMERLRDSLPDRVHLRVVGDGPRRAALERAIARARLHDRVELLGRRTREEIRALFAESDVFVLPTVRESFGLAALEARCAGLPVVAMRASGVAELVEHGRHGLLASSDVELTAHVGALVRDARRRAAIAATNRQDAPPFDWPAVLDAHLALYDEAITERGREASSRSGGR